MNKSITIISTKTWRLEGTLFHKDNTKLAAKELKNDVIEEYIKQEEWTIRFDDEELGKLCCNNQDYLKPKHITIKSLRDSSTARMRAIENEKFYKELYSSIKNKYDNNEDDKKSIQNAVPNSSYNLEIYQVICDKNQDGACEKVETDVYGIKALDSPQPANKWIPFLISVARGFVEKDDTLSVNLFLHDKDVKESSYYHDFIKEPNLENLLPEGKSLIDYNVENCTVIFYKHTHNPIINFISRKPDGDLSNSIKKIKEAANNLQAMVDDYKKINPESSRQEKPDGGLSESIEKIKQAASNLLSVVDDYKEINSESSDQGTRED